MKAQLLTATSVVALMFGTQADANVLVSTIVGAYDNTCRDATCGGVSGISFYAENSATTYDTPALYIYNPTDFDFTNATLKVTGYQGLNNGLTDTSGAFTIAAHTLYRYAWVGPTTGGSMFGYDYDDEYGNVVTAGSPGSYGNPDTAGHFCGEDPAIAPASICAFVGNFDVLFSATWNGNPIAANFSPDPGQGGGNAAGSFVGWLGLDPAGLSETTYDLHSSSFPGTLANIFTGTTGNQIPTAPEPASVALFGAGLGALGLARRRRKSA